MYCLLFILTLISQSRVTKICIAVAEKLQQYPNTPPPSLFWYYTASFCTSLIDTATAVAALKQFVRQRLSAARFPAVGAATAAAFCCTIRGPGPPRRCASRYTARRRAAPPHSFFPSSHSTVRVGGRLLPLPPSPCNRYYRRAGGVVAVAGFRIGLGRARVSL